MLAVIERQRGKVLVFGELDVRRHQVPVESGVLGAELRAGRAREPQAVAAAVRVRPQRDVLGLGVDERATQLAVALEPARREQCRRRADLARLAAR